jgi:hypothetical protein
MSRGNKAQNELESKMLILKQLEGVYKTSNDLDQRKRVAREIRDIKRIISNLQSILSLQQKYGLHQVQHELEGDEAFKLLSRIMVAKFINNSRDSEMDALVSYVDYYEKNYLPVLSEYYVKLDYNNSMKRDVFYPRYMEMKKMLNEYMYEVEVQVREEFTSIAVHKDKSLIYKLRQQYLMALDRYFRDLRAFLDELLTDHASGGSSVLNPLDFVSMSEFEVDRKMDGYTVINALMEIQTFSDEIIRFLAIPNM